VQRLDSYEREQPDIFTRVCTLITERFMPIIRRHAITGQAIVNSENLLFSEPNALAMIIDIFSERGYQVVVDINILDIPDRLDPKNSRIICRQKRVYRFHVSFEASAIRRGHHH
jgi:adenylate kinase